jgi:hypothetical protein
VARQIATLLLLYDTEDEGPNPLEIHVRAQSKEVVNCPEELVED